MRIEKRWHLLCDEPVLELPILDLKPKLTLKSEANSDYVLTSIEFVQMLYSWERLFPNREFAMHIDVTLEQLEQINKYWDICMSKNLDYMKIKFK